MATNFKANSHRQKLLTILLKDIEECYIWRASHTILTLKPSDYAENVELCSSPA